MNWKRNGVKVTSGLHSFGRRLTIGSPTSADTGVYVCEATLRGSAFNTATAEAFLSIIGNAGRQRHAGPGGAAPRGAAQKHLPLTGSLSNSENEGEAEATFQIHPILPFPRI